ncbi:MAG TPA: hypothetical protein VGK22_19305 [Candidatus Angelobacter sp.]
MKCEICKTIAKLELDESAHELWVCADARSPRVAFRKLQVSAHHFCCEMKASLAARWQAAGYMPYQRVHYVTLGL